MASESTCTLNKLTHKQQRALFKKQRRKLKRQALARTRENLLNVEEEASSPEYIKQDRVLKVEMEKQYQHHLWLQREAIAQAEFVKKKQQQERELTEKIKIQKQLEEELKIIEDKKIKENDEKNKVAQEKKTLEESVLSQTEKNKEGPWHNPIAPLTTELPVSTNERELCNFFMKTGACRFGDRCSRTHRKPSVSKTLLIHGMYSHFMIGQSLCDEYDTDIYLEYEESETYQHFKDFYEDVLPEFKAVGKVVQFKVCCNFEQHLRGNVYIQYQTENDAVAAFQKFNGRWYGGKLLSCEFTSVTKWKPAICGVYQSKRCPKGRSCNFLHVFKNPTKEFVLADIDRLKGGFDERDGRESSRNDRRYQSQSRRRSRSRSATSSRSYARHHRRRHRSRSRSSSDSSPNYRSKKRRTRSRSRNRSKSRSRRNSNTRSRYRSRSRSRPRSSSKSRQHRQPSKSRSNSPKEKSKTSREKHKHKSSKKKSWSKQSPDWSSAVEVSKPESSSKSESSETKLSDKVSPRVTGTVNASTG